MAYSSHNTIYGLWLQKQSAQQTRVADQQVRDEERAFAVEERDYQRQVQRMRQSQSIGADIERSRESAFNRNVKLAELEGTQAAEMGQAAPQYTNEKFNRYAENAGRGVEGARANQEFTSELGGQLDDRKSQNWQKSRMGAESHEAELSRQEYDYKQAERQRREEAGFTHSPGSEVFGRQEESNRRFDEEMAYKNKVAGARQTSANASSKRAHSTEATKTKSTKQQVKEMKSQRDRLFSALTQARSYNDEKSVKQIEAAIKEYDVALSELEGRPPEPWSGMTEDIGEGTTTGNAERSLAEDDKAWE